MRPWSRTRLPSAGIGSCGYGTLMAGSPFTGHATIYWLVPGLSATGFPDDVEEGTVSAEVRAVAGVLGHVPSGVVQAAALRCAKALKLVAGRPRTAGMSPAGVDPWPAMIAPVSQRSITA
jgi:hypothetical protein